MKVEFVTSKWHNICRYPQRLLLFLLLAVLVYLVGGPLVFLVLGSLTKTIAQPEITLVYLVRAYTDPYTLKLFGTSLVYTIGSTVLAVFLGGMAAWITERLRTPLQGLTRMCSLLSLIVSGLFIAIAWSLLLSPGAGMINIWLRSIFHVTQGPINIYSLGGMIWVQGLIGGPFAYLLISSLIRSMDPSLEEAARVSGSGLWGVFRWITIPLSLPAIFSVVLFRMVRDLESFEVPAVLGLPKGIEVLTTKIYTEVQLFRSYSMANAYALGLIALTVLGLYLYQRLLRGSYRFVTVTGKGAKMTKKMELGRWCWLPTTFLAGYIMVVFILPICTLLWYAFTRYPVQPSVKALSLLTLRNFSAGLNLPNALTGIRNSLILGGGASLICMLLASTVSWLTVRTNLRGRHIVDVLGFIPVTIPGITLGVALVWIYLTVPLPVYGTIWILLIGYVTAFLPVSIRFTTPGMTQIHKELEECAYVHRASWWITFWRIVIPLVLPSVLAAGLYVFLLVNRVLSMAIVVYTPSSIVLPVVVYNSWGESLGNNVVALALIMVVAMTPVAVSYNWVLKHYGLKGE